MGYVPDWSRKDHKKNSGGIAPSGRKQGGSLFHGNQSPARSQRSTIRLADGGDAEEAVLKAEGIEATKNDSGGLWSRLKAGNIDDPKSEAYDRYGAGMGRSIRAAKAEADNAEYLSSVKSPEPEPERTYSTTPVAGSEPQMPPVETPKPAAKPKQRPQISSYNQSPAETARLADQAKRTSEPKPKDDGSYEQAITTGVMSAAKKATTPAERSMERGRALREFLKRQFQMAPLHRADGGMVKKGKGKC